MITHHPVGENIIEYDEWITKICLLYSDIIVLHVAGHNHKEEWRMVGCLCSLLGLLPLHYCQ